MGRPEWLDKPILRSLSVAILRWRNVPQDLVSILRADVVEQLVGLSDVALLILLFQHLLEALHLLIVLLLVLFVLLVYEIFLLLVLHQHLLCSLLLFYSLAEVGCFVEVLYEIAVFICITTFTRLSVGNLSSPHLLVLCLQVRVQLIENLASLLHVKPRETLDLWLSDHIELLLKDQSVLLGLHLLQLLLLLFSFFEVLLFNLFVTRFTTLPLVVLSLLLIALFCQLLVVQLTNLIILLVCGELHLLVLVRDNASPDSEAILRANALLRDTDEHIEHSVVVIMALGRMIRINLT